MSYVGKKLKPCVGHEIRYGWQDIYKHNFPEIGKRWMANCEIPDLDLLPDRYGIKSIKFSAGMENGFIHLSIWILSWMIRMGININLKKHAAFLLKLSYILDSFGSSDGGMFMIIKGKDHDGNIRLNS